MVARWPGQKPAPATIRATSGRHSHSHRATLVVAGRPRRSIGCFACETTPQEFERSKDLGRPAKIATTSARTLVVAVCTRERGPAAGPTLMSQCRASQRQLSLLFLSREPASEDEPSGSTRAQPPHVAPAVGADRTAAWQQQRWPALQLKSGASIRLDLLLRWQLIVLAAMAAASQRCEEESAAIHFHGRRTLRPVNSPSSQRDRGRRRA